VLCRANTFFKVPPIDSCTLAIILKRSDPIIITLIKIQLYSERKNPGKYRFNRVCPNDVNNMINKIAIHTRMYLVPTYIVIIYLRNIIDSRYV